MLLRDTVYTFPGKDIKGRKDKEYHFSGKGRNNSVPFFWECLVLDVFFFFFFAETHNTEKKKERKAQCQVQNSYYFMEKGNLMKI